MLPQGVLDLGGALGKTIDLAAPSQAAQDAAAEAAEDAEHVLDLPPTWVPKLVIERDAYTRLKYGPLGSRSVLYRRAKLDLFAPRHHPQGLVARFMRFDDFDRTMLQVPAACAQWHRE